ncbi:MAG: hypothetical protein K8T89_09060 [Planctomycetes bacterium]|nr:hypothetical protein [Planctomycetota bacterium]
MRRISAIGAVAVLLLAEIGSAFAADPKPAGETPATPWYKRIFGSSKPIPTEKSVPVAAPTRQEIARSLEQEQKVYMERLQFCTKLRQIATETNDVELLRKADFLEQSATDVFMKRTSTLPSLLDDVKSSETALDQKKPNTPSGSASTTPKTVTGRAPNGKPIYLRD